MLDIVIGIVVLCFFLLGLYEGIVKSLGSVALAFVSLYLSSSTLAFLANGAPQFGSLNFLGAAIIFLVVFVVTYVIFDLLLTILLKKIIMIVVLGPLDKIGGLLIGGVKGLLLCGIVLQLVLYFPVSEATRENISKSTVSQLAISTYRFVYPYAKRLAPDTRNLMERGLLKGEGLEDKIKDIDNLGADKIVEKAAEIGKEGQEKIEKVKELLEERKLLPDAPQ